MDHKSCPRCGAAFICQLKKPVTKILYKANAPHWSAFVLSVYSPKAVSFLLSTTGDIASTFIHVCTCTEHSEWLHLNGRGYWLLIYLFHNVFVYFKTALLLDIRPFATLTVRPRLSSLLESENLTGL